MDGILRHVRLTFIAVEKRTV